MALLTYPLLCLPTVALVTLALLPYFLWLYSLTRYLREAGYNTDKIWDKIRALLVKSLLTVQPHLSHTYHALVCHTGLEP